MNIKVLCSNGSYITNDDIKNMSNCRHMGICWNMS
jgi:hypothetical protein